MTKARLTKRQKAVMKEWYDFTGWEFMAPYGDETFCDALRRNQRWLEDHTNEALRHIGADLLDEEFHAEAEAEES